MLLRYRDKILKGDLTMQTILSCIIFLFFFSLVVQLLLLVFHFSQCGKLILVSFFALNQHVCLVFDGKSKEKKILTIKYDIMSLFLLNHITSCCPLSLSFTIVVMYSYHDVETTSRLFSVVTFVAYTDLAIKYDECACTVWCVVVPSPAIT